MNLMDIISRESNGYQPEQVFENYLSAPANELHALGMDDKLSSIYYLPTPMSILQKDMSEAVIQMFASSLREEIIPTRQRSNINSLLTLGDDNDVNGHHDANAHQSRIISLIYNSLLTICMHPSLTVDHFIPKGLLLSSTKERMSSVSGKLMLFDRVVDSLVDNFEQQHHSQDYHLMVIAKSTKELELIEGLIIGKTLRYVNVSSGKKLFEGRTKFKRFVKEDTAEEEQTNEFKHKHQHFLAKRANKQYCRSSGVVLHLITSNHLYSSFTSEIQFDLIFSFDSELDSLSPGLDLLRSQVKTAYQLNRSWQSKIPVLVPIPIFSVEHISRMVQKPHHEFPNFHPETDREWRRQILNAFVGNRNQLFEEQTTNFFSHNYGTDMSSLTEWFFKWSSTPPPSSLNLLPQYTNKMEASVPYERLLTKLESNFLTLLGNGLFEGSTSWGRSIRWKFDELKVADYDGFKKRMAEFLNARISQIDTMKTEALTISLPALREKETRRQEEIDMDEERVGEQYRKLRKLNEEIGVVDRRFNRVELEHKKLQESVAESEQMYTHLKDVLENRSEEELRKLYDQQETLLQQFEQEKESLLAEEKTLLSESESVREEYQRKSTHAVQIAEQQRKLNEEKSALLKSLEGPGMHVLPSLAHKDELSIYEHRLNKLKQETTFINTLLSSRYEKVVKERNVLLDSSVSGSSSRSTARISRAPTPL